MSFKVSKEELKTYREEYGLGITEALDKIRKLKMIAYLEEGGTAEPVLLALLKDWAAESKSLVKVDPENVGT